MAQHQPLHHRAHDSHDADVESGDDERHGLMRHSSKISPSPLPKRQIFILACMHFSAPISFNVTFPFINQMIESMGIENPGYWTGFVDASFALAQTCSVYYLGQLSDRIGRRPILLYGLACISFSTMCFGLSSSFPMMLLFRAMVGANGLAGSIRSAMAELTDESNQGRAFSFLPVSWSVGSFIAPMIGGFLSRPAEKYPAIFGNHTIFTKYPYFLPCFVCAMITAMGFVVAYNFFEETKGVHRPIAIPTSPPDSPDSSHIALPTEDENSTREKMDFEDSSEYPVNMSPLEIVNDRYIRRVIISYTFLAFVSASTEPVYLLWLYTPVSKGGIGLLPSQIGIMMSCGSAFAFFNNLIVFPWLQKRLGTAKLFKCAISMAVVRCSLFPVITSIARWEAAVHETDTSAEITKAAIGCMIVLGNFAGLAWSCIAILICRSAPSKACLGSVNGLSQTIASSAKAMAPWLSTIIFAASNDPNYHFLGGKAIWIYFIFISSSGALASYRVQEGRGGGPASY